VEDMIGMTVEQFGNAMVDGYEHRGDWEASKPFPRP
jgi:hypothetical protein